MAQRADRVERRSTEEGDAVRGGKGDTQVQDAPEGELPEEPDASTPDGPASLLDGLVGPRGRAEGNDDDSTESSAPTGSPTMDGMDKPGAHDVTATDEPPDMESPSTSVADPFPWMTATDDSAGTWDQSSLTAIEQDEIEPGWNSYYDTNTGMTYEQQHGEWHASGNGDGDAAQEFALSAAVVQEELGAAGLRAEMEVVLGFSVSTGTGQANAPATRPIDQLSPAEQRVAELVATGASESSHR